MATEIQDREQELIEEFSMFSDWMEKYEYLIELGKELAPLDDTHKTEDNIIKGCQSQVWLHASSKDGLIQFEADSDAIITKGIIALLVRVLSNSSPQDIIDAELKFIDDIGLHEHLSPTRSNGLVSMVKQMKHYALAFSLKN